MKKQETMKRPKSRVTTQKNTRTEVIDDHKTRSETEREALKQELDDILDDIDEVLEENAQEFIDQYVQKGGE